MLAVLLPVFLFVTQPANNGFRLENTVLSTKLVYGSFICFCVFIEIRLVRLVFSD